jgi:hypothetical protein
MGDDMRGIERVEAENMSLQVKNIDAVEPLSST